MCGSRDGFKAGGASQALGEGRAPCSAADLALLRCLGLLPRPPTATGERPAGGAALVFLPAPVVLLEDRAGPRRLTLPVSRPSRSLLSFRYLLRFSTPFD